MDEYKPNENQNYYGYVYLILDQKHNKIYVGKKSGKVEKTKNYFGSGVIIQNIIKSRGTYFLKKRILGICSNKKELEKCEIECIDYYYATNSKYGYNILRISTSGSYKGRVPWNKGLTKETDERVKKLSENEIRNKKIGELSKINNLGKKVSKKAKENMSKSHIGIKDSDETKKRKSESHKGEKSYLYKKTYEEVHGEEKGKKLREKLSKIHQGKKKY